MLATGHHGYSRLPALAFKLGHGVGVQAPGGHAGGWAVLAAAQWCAASHWAFNPLIGGWRAEGLLLESRFSVGHIGES